MPGKYDGRKLLFGGVREYVLSQPEDSGEVTIDFGVARVPEPETEFEKHLAANAAFVLLADES